MGLRVWGLGYRGASVLMSCRTFKIDRVPGLTSPGN